MVSVLPVTLQTYVHKPSPPFKLILYFTDSKPMEVDANIKITEESVADCMTATPSHMTTSCPSSVSSCHGLPEAALLPACVCLREVLVSRLLATSESRISQLDSLVQYLVRVPCLQLCELEPLLMWRHRVRGDMNEGRGETQGGG